ncbi:hypothetical protein B0T20DRAFT_389239 [Sordaria brevicollis]|uniref:Uncharacterized protein n=1 Tax=Sordaria brevicollis TaxID=83679 RepID=A0AAE0PPH9_SORBR|nr:hypothetical protein B0T20DRAFT_389239 [Sordaria brevicollis]
MAHFYPPGDDEVAENSGRKDFSIEPWFHGGDRDLHLNGAFCSERAAKTGLGRLNLAERFAANHLQPPTEVMAQGGPRSTALCFAYPEEKAWFLVGFLEVGPGEFLSARWISVCRPWTVSIFRSPSSIQQAAKGIMREHRHFRWFILSAPHTKPREGVRYSRLAVTLSTDEVDARSQVI